MEVFLEGQRTLKCNFKKKLVRQKKKKPGNYTNFFAIYKKLVEQVLRGAIHTLIGTLNVNMAFAEGGFRCMTFTLVLIQS